MSGGSDDKLVFLSDAGGADPGSAEAALRERAATAMERGLRFIEGSGDAGLQKRAHVALQALPVEAELDALSATQRQDGSFPRSGVPSTIEALGLAVLDAHPTAILGSLDALSAMSDLRCLYAPAAQRAEAFLRSEQHADGSWGDPNGEPETRLFLTGTLAGLLGRTRFVRPEVLEGAGSFLASLWSPDRVEGGEGASIAAFAHFYTNVHHDLADEALQWCGRELERGFRNRRFEAVFAARVMLWCDAAALPGFGVEPPELLERLLEEQASDGGFAALAVGGRASRGGPTLDALRAIVSLCASL